MYTNSTIIARPWFIAVTAPLFYAVGFEQLRITLSKELDLNKIIPGHQILMNENIRHATVLILARINAWDSIPYTAEDYASHLLTNLLEALPDLSARTRDVFEPVELEAYELVCFDVSTTIQFREINGTLSRIRLKLKTILEKPLHELCSNQNQTDFAMYWAEKTGKTLIEPLLNDMHRNSGGNCFASVARSPNPNELTCVRWRRILKPIKLTFQNLHLVYSDEMLTNPQAINRGFIIGG